MKNEKGFTLIEIVVSIAILSILIVPFFGIFTNAARLGNRSENDLTANYLAQHLAAAQKENPMICSYIDDSDGWTRSTDGTATVFKKSSLGGDYLGYGAVLTYDGFNPSEPAYDWDEFLANACNYSAIFDYFLDSKSRSIDFAYLNESIASRTIDGPSNDLEIFLENCEMGVNYFTLRIKIASYQQSHDFELDEESDNILINIKLNPAIDKGEINKNRKVTVKNTTFGINHKKKARPLHLDVAKENFEKFSQIKFITQGDISSYNPDDIEINISESNLNYLTIEILGYDPICGTNKVLKKLITCIRTDS